MKKSTSKVRAWLRKNTEELYMLSGFAFLLIGTYFIAPVACWFVGGAMCLILWWLEALGNRK